MLLVGKDPSLFPAPHAVPVAIDMPGDEKDVDELDEPSTTTVWLAIRPSERFWISFNLCTFRAFSKAIAA
jgi:hypothetical protein